MSTKHKLIIMNTFISSQFGYCPLMWMCHSRALNIKINRIHERDPFGVWLSENLLLLPVEMYKTYNLSSNLMLDIFKVALHLLGFF